MRRQTFSRRSLLKAAAVYGLNGAAPPALLRGATLLSAHPGPGTPAAGTNAAAAPRAAFNNRGLTPTWGFNTYYAWSDGGYDETTIIAAATAMRGNGLWDAGYRMFGIDDGWSSGRDAHGTLIADPKKFPSGLDATVSQLHALGFDAGIYGDIGDWMCGGGPGSYQHEAQDAQWFADRGFDYVKMDWCGTDGFNAQAQFGVMSQAILATGRPMTFSICNWGKQNPWQWAPAIANSARTTTDIDALYDGDQIPGAYSSENWSSFLKNLDGNQHPEAARPGYANDPDMLRVGNGFFDNAVEEQAQLQLWAIMGAPMLIGFDVQTVSDELLQALTHPALRTVNQDALAQQGTRVNGQHGSEVWLKPFSDTTSYAMVLFNRKDAASTASIQWRSLWKTDTAYVRDLWNNREIGVRRGGFTVPLTAHASMLLQVVPQF